MKSRSMASSFCEWLHHGMFLFVSDSFIVNAAKTWEFLGLGDTHPLVLLWLLLACTAEPKEFLGFGEMHLISHCGLVLRGFCKMHLVFHCGLIWRQCSQISRMPRMWWHASCFLFVALFGMIAATPQKLRAFVEMQFVFVVTSTGVTATKP